MRQPAHRLDRRRRTRHALEGISLHAGPAGTLTVPMGTLARFMDTRKRNVTAVLEDLRGAVDIEGSLETRIEQWGEWTVMDWVDPPVITVREDFRSADNEDMTIEEFYEEEPVTRAEFEYERGYQRGYTRAMVEFFADLKAQQDKVEEKPSANVVQLQEVRDAKAA
jgi:hypothetical protein